MIAEHSIFPALLEGIGPVQKMRLVQIGGEWSIEVTQS
jgi:hypothetical protein